MKFLLTLLPNGGEGAPKAILAPVDGTLTADEARHIRALWDEWAKSDEALLVMGVPVEVVTVKEIELELPE